VYILTGLTIMNGLAVTAAEAGVTFVAGTDSQPCGRIANEIGALAAAGVPPHQAIGAAS
jgi:imidazolonepropionase-like amidohydrolase